MSSRKFRIFAGFLKMAGFFLLLLLAAACLLLTVPRLFGYRIYAVVSGSMEPAISTGSLVYVRERDPGEIVAGDVIAFYGDCDETSVIAHGVVITHRVVENRAVMGDFITKGDANQSPDMKPAPYAGFIGKVERSIPKAGRIAQALTSFRGKLLSGAVLMVYVLLQAIALLMENRA